MSIFFWKLIKRYDLIECGWHGLRGLSRNEKYYFSHWLTRIYTNIKRIYLSICTLTICISYLLIPSCEIQITQGDNCKFIITIICYRLCRYIRWGRCRDALQCVSTTKGWMKYSIRDNPRNPCHPRSMFREKCGTYWWISAKSWMISFTLNELITSFCSKPALRAMLIPNR